MSKGLLFSSRGQDNFFKKGFCERGASGGNRSWGLRKNLAIVRRGTGFASISGGANLGIIFFFL